MPTYEYLCKKCRHQFEQFQKITAKSLRKCPKCGGRVERVIGSGAGILFKGSGFYQTDYRSSKYQEAAKKDKKPETPPGSSEGAKPKADKKS